MGVLVSRFHTKVYRDECFGPGLGRLTTQHNTLAPNSHWHCSSSLATMALNDQALLEEWSSQHDGKDIEVGHWQIGSPPKHICKAFEHVANAANANTVAWPTEWSDKAIIACWKCAIEPDGDNEWRRD
jgi:hypothetical protein